MIFWFEDIILCFLSSLSLILICFKLLHFNPSLQVISGTFIGSIFIIVCFYFAIVKNVKGKKILFKFNKLHFKLFSYKHFILFTTTFTFYLIRAFLKAKTWSEFVYIPSRYNTDIFLYLRRISVFLNSNNTFDSQYDGVSEIDLLYDSPKLLSSFIYALLANIFQHPGIAGTILTSLIISAIAFKYILLLNKSSLPKLWQFTVIIFLLFQPSLTWLQDQFYLSNLLYVYLLIYGVEDLLLVEKSSNRLLLKFGLSAIAISGFYPSQLPFFALATIILILLTNWQRARKVNYIFKIAIVTAAILLIFITQFIDTSEVNKHFNLADSQHGINFTYIPFWSLLNLVPKPGGFKVNLGSISLVIVSLLIAILVTKFLSKRNPEIAKYLYISLFLYNAYSISFIIFPGSYRQGKFFVTYIIPLVLFCFVKILQQPKVAKNSVVMGTIILLTVYVSWYSFDRRYKSHLTLNEVRRVESLITEDRPITIYHKELDHKYFYFSYLLKDNPLTMISHCPSIGEIEEIEKEKDITIISEDCNM